jgi:hypothetical protein
MGDCGEGQLAILIGARSCDLLAYLLLLLMNMPFDSANLLDGPTISQKQMVLEIDDRECMKQLVICAAASPQSHVPIRRR